MNKKLIEKWIKWSIDKQLKVFNKTFLTRFIFILLISYIKIFKPKK